MFIMMIEDHEVKVGDEVRVGMQVMIVDEITEFDTVIVIDQDGGELELTENEIDVFINR
jgi:small-conductance mechanosensitive channel